MSKHGTKHIHTQKLFCSIRNRLINLTEEWGLIYDVRIG